MGTKSQRKPVSEEQKETAPLILRPYETFFIIKSSLSDDEVTAIVDKIKGVIEGEGGEIVAVDNWGKKKLAYEVQKEQKGIYIVIHFKGPGKSIFEVERNYRITEPIIKYMTIVIDEDQLGQTAPVREEKVYSSRGRSDGRRWR